MLTWNLNCSNWVLIVLYIFALESNYMKERNQRTLEVTDTELIL